MAGQNHLSEPAHRLLKVAMVMGMASEDSQRAGVRGIDSHNDLVELFADVCLEHVRTGSNDESLPRFGMLS